MSVHYSSLVWDIQMPNSGRKLVALALADMADDEGGCWPSLKSLSDRCQMRPEAIRDHLAHLCAVGLISKEERFKNNRQTSNLYNFMPLPELRGRVAKIARGEGGDFHQGGGGRKSLPRESSVKNRHIETSKVKGKSTDLPPVFSDWRPRPLPLNEEDMYASLEEAGIEIFPDHDGRFYDDMQKKDWTLRGKPIADWHAVYAARVQVTTPRDKS